MDIQIVPDSFGKEAKTVSRNGTELMLPSFSLTRFTVCGLVSIEISLVCVVLASFKVGL